MRFDTETVTTITANNSKEDTIYSRIHFSGDSRIGIHYGLKDG